MPPTVFLERQDQRRSDFEAKLTISTIDISTLRGIFERMDDAIGMRPDPRPQTLCVFGAAAILLYGADERQTQNIDVWFAASEASDRALSSMTRAAGIGLNPTELDPGTAYLQVVREGTVQLPPHSKEKGLWGGGKPSELLWKGNYLTIVSPPPAVVAAAKLVRAEPQDIQDVLFILRKRGLTLQDVAAAICTFPERAQEPARENLVLVGATREAPARGLNRGGPER